MTTSDHGSRTSRRTARVRAVRLLAVALVVVAAGVALVVVSVLSFASSAPRDAASTAALPPSSGGPVADGASRPSAQPVASPASSAQTVTVAAVGDLSFSRGTADVIAKRGGAAPLANVAPLLASADLTIGNLEGVIATSGPEAKWKDVRLRGDPRAVSGLQLAGFDVVSLANNHAFDFGWPAMRDTLGALDGARIAHAGAGPDAPAAWRPAVLSRRGTSVAFLSFTRVLPNGFGAGRNHPGVASAYEEGEVARAIRDAKKRYGLVVVSFHWGVEKSREPQPAVAGQARDAIDAGADLVIGHHPHVIQGLEAYHGGLIAYSLGDFVFEHYTAETGEAFVLDAEVGPSGVGEVRVTPVYLDFDGTPSVVSGKTAQRILGRLKELSAKRGTSLVIEGDTARVVTRAKRS